MVQDLPTLPNRYDLETTLGEGGMGVVYRAWDSTLSRKVALKRLVVRNESQRSMLTALFEREFYTLAQLSHPSVIEVFDYGLDEQGPFYTMELLEGSDLRGAQPIRHDELCGILYDIASSLALLHARRLVHRDVTSGNIRITGPGRAKLIDFGALAPMGPVHGLVGTPMYVAPEVVLMQPLDGRADLYSLGVVLYRALTGRYPYRAGAMRALREAWRVTPPSPQEISEDAPRALSELAMSLIALNRDWRPRNAAEVMERLAAIGSLDRVDAPEASHAYLVTPALVGRSNGLRQAREVLVGAIRGRGGALLVSGAPGVGRSRMLDAVALEAKVLGVTVLRAGAPHADQGDFAAVDTLLGQLSVTESGGVDSAAFERASSQRSASSIGKSRLENINAVRNSLVKASKSSPIVVIVDDVDLLDEPSIATLASLAQDAPGARLALFAAAPANSLADSPPSLRLLAARSDALALEPLDGPSMQNLMRSIFGTVPHVDHLAARIHRISRGYPRDAMALAEHLVDRGVISYRGGAFSLPEKLDVDDLPDSLSAALETRIQSLTLLARSLAQAHALSGWASLSLDQCRKLCPDARPADVFRALDDLVAADVLRLEGTHYLLRHEGWRPVLVDLGDDAERAERHRTLARLLEQEGEDPLAQGYHLMQAGEKSGVDRVARYAIEFAGEGVEVLDQTRLSSNELGWLFSSVFDALSAAGTADRRTLGRLRYFMMTLGVFVDARWFFESAEAVESSLKRDAGYFVWESLDPGMAPMPRLFTALQQAQAAYDAAPSEHQYPPPKAIRHLVQYVVAAIAVGARTANGELRRRLPAMLEPFAPLSPVVEAMKENSRSAAESTYADYENAANRLEPVVEALSAPDAASIEHADEIRAACIYAIGAYRARLGIQAAAEWNEQVADHPRHASNVSRTRAALALHRGDWEAAEAGQRAAEQYDVEHDCPQLFGRASVLGEIDVYARGLDMTAVGQLIAVIEPHAEKYEGWRPYLDCARAEYERLRGDHGAAFEGFDRAVAATSPKRKGEHPDAGWYLAEAGALEMLIELGRLDECRARAERSLTHGDGKATGARYDGVKRALALCEAKLGDIDAARTRLETLIEHRKAIGSSGLWLGLLYEARTLVELWHQDLEAAEVFFRLTRAELVPREGSGFARRVDDLRRRLTDGGRERESISPPGAERPEEKAERVVFDTLSSCPNATTRATQGLTLLCKTVGAVDGYLYLMDAGGLQLTASTSDEGPPTGLDDYVRRRLDLEYGGSDTADPTTLVTVTLDVDSDELLRPFKSEKESSRRAYHPVWIRANLAGRSSLVGVAALGVEGSDPLSAAVQPIASAFGDLLVRAGDTVVGEHLKTAKST